MSVAIVIVFKINNQLSAVSVERDEQCDQQKLPVQPDRILVTAPSLSCDQCAAKEQGQYSAWGCDAEVELTFHELKTLDADGVIAHRVINE